jgi:sulfate permease, SulP family
MNQGPNPGVPAPLWHLFVPKLVTVLRQGYRAADFRSDLVAGTTVAIVALPLAMALAIASGAPPEKGLHTAIIAGFLISALGGSRLQIGGPTAAFIPLVYNVIQTHGFDGLVLATLMAGLLLVLAGLLRIGTLMKYMPQPVVTGFTAGIAVSIFLSQIRDALGLEMAELPGEFLARLAAYRESIDTWSLWALGMCLAALALIVLLKRWRPTWPGFLIAVGLGAFTVALFALPVDTIGSRFGGLPTTLPAFVLPEVSIERIGLLMPAAFTIAFLAGVESLLSATVADGMTGGRHRSNCELVAQGVANGASALFGGLPATGAIARTATNVRAGGRTPVAGIVHALVILLAVLLLAPLAFHVPLPVLAAVLLVVAWNMSEVERLRHLLKLPRGDRLVLLVTFALTVAVDLTVAIQVGVVLAAFLFMHRMAEVVEMDRRVHLVEEELDDLTSGQVSNQRARLPEGVEAFRISGPLFFAVANRLEDALRQFPRPPRVFILRMRLVPLIDASGAAAVEHLIGHCRRHGTLLILSGLRPQPRKVLAAMGILEQAGLELAANFEVALQRASEVAAAAPE